MALVLVSVVWLKDTRVSWSLPWDLWILNIEVTKLWMLSIWYNVNKGPPMWRWSLQKFLAGLEHKTWHCLCPSLAVPHLLCIMKWPKPTFACYCFFFSLFCFAKILVVSSSWNRMSYISPSLVLGVHFNGNKSETKFCPLFKHLWAKRPPNGHIISPLAWESPTLCPQIQPPAPAVAESCTQKSSEGRISSQVVRSRIRSSGALGLNIIVLYTTLYIAIKVYKP